AMGLVTAGLAFALQRVVTALAGYVLILRGQTFNVGDRIVMGGVRMELFGVDLVGVNAENGRKLLVTLGALALAWGAGGVLILAARALVPHGRALFWARQGVRLAIAVLFLFVVVSIWFDDPTRLATALGLVTAGLAFALQKVITAVAGYFVILRGQTFNVGDRITMGGVRGDVIALSFTQTTIMEMGQPPAVQNADPAMWVRSRQYTGRVVTVRTRAFSTNRSSTTRASSLTTDSARGGTPPHGGARQLRPSGARGARAPLFRERKRDGAGPVLPAHRQLARTHRALHRTDPRHSRA
ncbi:MAG TPA: mechanosensitive ion channel domain-containing protein, partial [Burkholderiales bacterium]